MTWDFWYLEPWAEETVSFSPQLPAEFACNHILVMSSDIPIPAKRVCQIIKLEPSRVDEYKKIHADVWPGVLAGLKKAHITDYSIHHYPPLRLLIATFKYTGDNYDADMRKVAEDPEMQRWWQLTDGMQESFVNGATGSGKEAPWWQELEEVFRFEG